MEDGGEGGGGLGEILFRFVYVPDIRVRPHYFSFYFYKLGIGARGRGRVIYIFSDSRVQSNFFGERGGGGGEISLESIVQGPGKLLGNDLKRNARLIEQLRFTNLFAQYFD